MSPSAPPSDAPPAGRRVRRLPWLLLLAFALVELVGHFVVRARVPAEGDWQGAAAYVRAELSAGDLVLTAPDWADPLMREAMGDALSLSQVAPADLAPFERLWVFSVRGHRHPDAPDRAPDGAEAFGRVQVRRWDLGPSPVVYDLTEEIRRATVTIRRDGADRPCPWRRASPGRGGLGAGPMAPPERFVCGGQPWLWVGPTVMEDLELRPRRCIWQHPQGTEPIRVTYPDVPLGDRLVLYAGLYYEHERKLEGGPVQVRVLVDGEEVGTMTHRDGDGFKRMESRTRVHGAERERGDVSIEVTAAQPHLRTLCWSATLREGER